MHLHVNNEILKSDLEDLLNGFITAVTGFDKHRTHAKRLKDPARIERISARFNIAVNCASCSESIYCDMHAIYERGTPISISLVDEKCPHCHKKDGYKYVSTRSLYA